MLWAVPRSQQDAAQRLRSNLFRKQLRNRLHEAVVSQACLADTGFRRDNYTDVTPGGRYLLSFGSLDIPGSQRPLQERGPSESQNDQSSLTVTDQYLWLVQGCIPAQLNN